MNRVPVGTEPSTQLPSAHQASTSYRTFPLPPLLSSLLSLFSLIKQICTYQASASNLSSSLFFAYMRLPSSLFSSHLSPASPLFSLGYCHSTHRQHFSLSLRFISFPDLSLHLSLPLISLLHPSSPAPSDWTVAYAQVNASRTAAFSSPLHSFPLHSFSSSFFSPSVLFSLSKQPCAP